MNNKLDTNVFFYKGNFNLKLNPLYRPKVNHQLLVLSSSSLLLNLFSNSFPPTPFKGSGGLSSFSLFSFPLL
jgi:hypothetical protein